MLEWNASYGFLNCKRHLSLFTTDAEHQFKSKECIDSTELWMYNKAEKSNDGDLHYPVTLPGAGKYDLVTFSQTLEHIYDPVRTRPKKTKKQSCPTTLLHNAFITLEMGVDWVWIGCGVLGVGHGA